MKLPEGFIDANTLKSKRRLIASISGPQKTGKTNLALTAPAPIAFYDMDMGTEGVVEKFAAIKKVYRSQYDYRMLTAPDIAGIIVMWEKMKKDFIWGLESPDVATPIVDTGTEMWELLRMARFGKLTQVKPFHYGPVNAEFRDLIRLAYASSKDVIFTHKMKNEYIDDRRTGKIERAGFSDMGFLVQINIETWYSEGEFGATIVDCRQNMDVAGMELTGEMCDWEFIKGLVFG